MLKFLKKLKSQKINMLLFVFPKDKNEVGFDSNREIVFFEEKNEYGIVDNGLLIHRSKIFKSSFLLRNFNFQKPFIVIGDCYTHDKYRGMGLYPMVLRHIAIQHMEKKQVYILVSSENIPSIKGIEKAGFRFVARMTCFKFLFFYFNKKLTTYI